MRMSDAIRIHLKGYYCIYCGDIATTKEHFPPASYSMSGVILPCCRECNCFAGTNYATDFEERVLYVKNKIKKKYYAVLNTPDWSKDDLCELGYLMQTKVEQWARKKKLIQEKLAWSVVAYLSSIDRSNVFVAINADNNFTTWSEKEFLMKLKEINDSGL